MADKVRYVKTYKPTSTPPHQCKLHNDRIAVMKIMVEPRISKRIASHLDSLRQGDGQWTTGEMSDVPTHSNTAHVTHLIPIQTMLRIHNKTFLLRKCTDCIQASKAFLKCGQALKSARDKSTNLEPGEDWRA